MKTKEEFHKLIDGIEDESLLKGSLELIKSLSKNQTGELWNELTESEKKELLLAFDESLKSDETLSHAQVKEKHVKWLDQ